MAATHATDRMSRMNIDGISKDLSALSVSTANGDSHTYRHEALLDPSTHIRLLELEDLAAWEERGAHCKLTIWPLQDTPTYHTISYTWGDPTPKRAVHVDDRALQVPESSFAVLRQLAYFKTSRYYWIDAICIAQGDVAEKNGQVALMGSIYQRAEHTLVCLDGNIDDKVESVLSMISELEVLDLLPTRLPARQHPDTIWADLVAGADEETENEANEEALIANFTAFFDALGHRLSDFMVGLTDLSSRSYFDRVWVIQEIILATSASVYCGTACIAVTAIERYMNAVGLIWDAISNRGDAEAEESPISFMRKLQRLASPLVNVEGWRMKGDATRLIEYRVLAEGRCGTQLFLPHEALFLTQHRSCADRRDAIYGMLGLIDWVGAEPLLPDYNKSAFRVAVEYCISSKMNTTEVDTVIHALGVDLIDAVGAEPIDTELRDAVVARQMQLLFGPNDTPDPSCTIAVTPVKGGYYGIQIVPDSCHWCGPGSFLLVDGDDGHETPFYALHLRWSDWIIYQRTQEPSILPKHGFVVRWSDGEIFHVINRAYFPEDWPQTFNRKFKVAFDPEDLIVSACILAEANYRGLEASFARFDEHDEHTRNLLATPVCRFLTSSYAKVRARDDEKFERELVYRRRLRGYG